MSLTPTTDAPTATAQTASEFDLKAAKQVRAQFGGISEPTLWRWVKDPKLNFPRPIKISGRLYFKALEIDQWVASQAEGA